MEHILPQSPSAAWSHIPLEDAKAYYNRIGNLALMKATTNSKIGNASPKVKLLACKDSEFRLTTSIAQSSKWDIEEIRRRQEKLAELAIKAWPVEI